jgi:hypothetical protein
VSAGAAHLFGATLNSRDPERPQVFDVATVASLRLGRSFNWLANCNAAVAAPCSRLYPVMVILRRGSQ